MTVTVNGQRCELPDGATLADLLERLDVPRIGVAVALDGAVAPRALWPDTVLRDGASVEVLTAAQGG
jgi:sulfur carrier protein